MNELISNHFRLRATVNSGTGTLSDISTKAFSNIKFTGTGVTINGFADVVEEKVVFIHNLTGSPITVKNATGTAANQIVTGLGADYSLADGASLALIYAGGKWRPISPLNNATGGGGGGGTGLTTVAVKTSAHTAAVNTIVPFDSTGGIFNITLPPTAALGDQIEIVDIGGLAATNNVTVLRNGNLINGVASDLIFNVNHDRVHFIYITAYGWSAT